MRTSIHCLLACAALGLTTARASGAALTADRLKVQRKEVFAFTEKPTVTRDGDTFTICFAVKDYCDATVAIERIPVADAGEGMGWTEERPKIARFLASGVLGPNAPGPFQNRSLRQTVVWDGKDEIGRYIDDVENYRVRVSLGLRARMERTLWWSGVKAAQATTPKYGGRHLLMAPTPEGIVVWLNGSTPQLILYDHGGNYVRTLYPFPSKAVGRSPDECRIQGMKWRAYPPGGEELPDKLLGHDQDTFLPDEDIWDLVVHGDRVWMIGVIAKCIKTDGSARLSGPTVAMVRGKDGKGEPVYAKPTASAISPDGKRLYTTGYAWLQGSYDQRWFHVVNVTDLEGDGTMRPFVGDAKGYAPPKGSDNAHFRCPMGVACDAKGRVYVADNANNRLQVYQPDGTFLKSVPVTRPGFVRVHPKTGEIYVVSSDIGKGYGGVGYSRTGGIIGLKDSGRRPTVLTHFGPVEKPDKKGAWKLPVPGHSYDRCSYAHDANGIVDFYADEPRFWLSISPNHRGNYRVCSARIYRLDGRKLRGVRDFGVEAERVLIDPRAPRFNRPRLYVNPATGLCHLALITHGTAVACKSFKQTIKIDSRTGRLAVHPLPTDPEDMGFDWEGRAYLRTFNAITRFDSKTWREIPFDYGDRRTVNHGAGGGGEKPYRATSAITLPSTRGGMFHMGGFGVAPDGTTAVSCINPHKPGGDHRGTKNAHGGSSGKAYVPPIYPGRNAGWETHLFDRHGKLLQADAVPGIGVSNFLQIDHERRVYMLCASTPYIDGKRYFNGRGCTLMKVTPGRMKGLTVKGILPLPPAMRPKRPIDMTRPGIWAEGADWLFGPVGADGHYGSGGRCSCYVNGRFDLDYFGRSFAPEVDRFRVVVLDTNGNVILRIGQYGNVDDGVPLVTPDPKRVGQPGWQPLKPRSIGGDEVGIMHAQNLAVHNDSRLFLADVGNQCVRCVRLGYHVTEAVSLEPAQENTR
jgi:hypothetical protein